MAKKEKLLTLKQAIQFLSDEGFELSAEDLIEVALEESWSVQGQLSESARRVVDNILKKREILIELKIITRHTPLNELDDIFKECDHLFKPLLDFPKNEKLIVNYRMLKKFKDFEQIASGRNPLRFSLREWLEFKERNLKELANTLHNENQSF